MLRAGLGFHGSGLGFKGLGFRGLGVRGQGLGFNLIIGSHCHATSRTVAVQNSVPLQGFHLGYVVYM